MAKDLFSNQSETYAKYRPTYPQELFDYILEFVEQRKCAWDCGTGNGQAAGVLADYFEKVKASDISEAQISKAVRKSNIEYRVCPAEQTPFVDNSFDLITVAQAYHWINWSGFHQEATRVGKNNCVVAIWTYTLLQSSDEAINGLIHHFYRDITGPYWDPARKYVDEKYQTVSFDFDPLASKEFQITVHWTKEQFTGFLNSWSAVQHYIRKNNQSPISLIQTRLDTLWPRQEQKKFFLPIFLRLGQVKKEWDDRYSR
jgi:ubiquinone/menaquinone biosynthesis C-methylase UbiE